VLTQVRTLTPNAELYVLGYFNPFAADPASPAAPVFNAGGMALNGTIQSLAAQFGASYVDTAAPFVGHEAQYTFLAAQPNGSSVSGPFGGVLPIGNVHPNDLGYSVIAAAVAASTPVPEPAAWSVLTVSLVAMGFFSRRRGTTSGTI